MQLTAGEHGLEEVAGVHRAVGLARADDGVQLVDEEDDASLTLLDLLEDGLQTLLELAAVLRARDQGTEVEREDPALFQAVRHVPMDDTLCQSLGDGGLADARLTDQDGVVLGLAREDADDVADLGVASDHGVELVLLGHVREVGAVFLEDVIRLLGVLAGDAGAAAYLRQSPQERVLLDAELPDDLLQILVRLIQHTQHQMLDGDILVLHPGRLVLCGRERLVHRAGDIHLPRLPPRPCHGRQSPDDAAQRRLELTDVLAHLLHELADQTVLLRQKCREQVYLLDLLVRRLDRETLRLLQGLRRPARKVLCIHDDTSFRVFLEYFGS